MSEPIQVDFVNAKSRPAQGSFELVFHVPIEQADEALKALGGFPQPGSNRLCAIVRLKNE